MIAELIAFDRLSGTMELPDNYDLQNDIHLSFDRMIALADFSGRQITESAQQVTFRVVAFRFSGGYTLPPGEARGRPIFHLIDLIK
jgi:hypothetical protein